MTENRAISKAETTGMTLEDVLVNLINGACPEKEMEFDCFNVDNCVECVANYIRKSWEKLK